VTENFMIYIRLAVRNRNYFVEFEVDVSEDRYASVFRTEKIYTSKEKC
jgi:hypothetical protein